MTIAADQQTLIRVCGVSDLEVERGRAALFGTTQIALFLLADGSVHALDNFDPFSGANVMSRGIVGSKGEAPTVASPMHKQIFDLRTGECLEAQGKTPVALRVWPVTVVDGTVYIDSEELR
ncbi:nitrite reductase small subunit NirD [Microbacterium sp. GXF0217]